jgi:hypothetical protein
MLLLISYNSLFSCKPFPLTQFAITNDMPLFAVTTAFFSLALFAWWSCDHSYPFWDGAAHVKDSIAYAQLLKHAHIFKASWIKQFLTVNYDYPLTVHFFNGSIKALFGYARQSDMIAMLLYQLVLLASMYYLAVTLGKSKVAAALSALFISVYPLVSILSHVPLLDYPYLAFTTLGLLGVAIFDKGPSYKNAVIMGICLALGATSKQISTVFLIAPCLLLLGRALLKRQWQTMGQLAVAGAFPAAGLLLWLLPNLKALAAWRDYYKNDPTLGGGPLSVFIDHFSHYTAGLVSMLSPGLLILAVVSASWLIKKKALRANDLYIPIAACACGLLAMCCVALNKPEERYIIPVAIVPALLTGQAIADWSRKNTTGKIAAIALTAFAVLQFILLNYTPYPINLSPQVVATVATIAGHDVKQEAVEPRPSPTPPGDRWGQEWIVAQIDNAEKKSTQNKAKITLNILPSTPDLSVHTIDLVCIFAGTRIEPSTFRQFTLHGDTVRDDPGALAYYDWYLLKTGYQGGGLDSDASKQNYQKITDYVTDGQKFDLYGERPLPDGSKLMLYKRKAI